MDGNRTVFRGSSKKEKRSRPRSDGRGIQECEDLREESDGEYDDEEQQNDVYLQEYQGHTDEESAPEEDFEQDDQEENEPEQDEFLETFLAAWRAKKATRQRLRRGFGSPEARSRGPVAHRAVHQRVTRLRS